MRILVVSDSHGDTESLCLAVSRTGPELILHLGDHDSDCAVLYARFPQIPLRRVRGNCDGVSREAERDEFVVEGKRIFMTHGHRQYVKSGLDSLMTAAGICGADIALFGHTHMPLDAEIDGLRLINPGSIGTGRKTYAVLEIQHGAISCEHRSIFDLM